MVRLFSYGTLRLPVVQLAVFGRRVPTLEDTLPGFRLDSVRITDPGVLATSGLKEHPILRWGAGEDCVAGATLELSPAELVAADEYEVDDYDRIEVSLGSGVRAWVYVAASDVQFDGQPAE
ncbi:MAG: gamma-glutamylcyclotransferase family protein [Dermatophilaceae bacterium]